MRNAVDVNKCYFSYKERKANPLKIWDFYFNLDYWLSDYRMSSNVLNDDRCSQVVFLAFRDVKRSARIAFINDSGNISFVLVSQVK
jgi:hypothetical protein